MTDKPTDTQIDFVQFRMSDLVACRNKVARLIKDSGLLKDSSHLTISALGLLFVEACQAKPLVIAQNMKMLCNTYQLMEIHDAKTVESINLESIHIDPDKKAN